MYECLRSVEDPDNLTHDGGRVRWNRAKGTAALSFERAYCGCLLFVCTEVIHARCEEYMNSQNPAETVGMDQYSFFGGFGESDDALEGGLEVH